MYHVLALPLAVGMLALGPQEQALEANLQSIADQYSLFWNFSLSFAVYNESVDIAVAAGANDYARPQTSRLSPEHRIPSGSTTKMYLAVAVLRLIEEGLIELDQPLAPLVDRYLAKPAQPCEDAPSYCEAQCASRAECFATVNCTDLAASDKAQCSYCLRYLHCYPKPGQPTAATLRGIWDGADNIERVTFRHILAMTSGLRDYYNSEGGAEWLYFSVLNSTHDVEPLEYLMHQSHQFLFDPGATTLVPDGVQGAGQNVSRAAYSTNGFSLVGLALTGLFDLDNWAQLDQRKLAWGDALPADDGTLFPTRGTCSSYADIAHQYTSESANATFVDITNHSCLNSWTGGNIAPRPRDVARFTHAVNTGRLLKLSSLIAMRDFHPLTDGFAAYQLAYGLGLEGLWSGKGIPFQVCSGGTGFGHAGLDYGSGSNLNFYVPAFGMSVSLAFTSGFQLGGAVGGMNCTRPWNSLPAASSYVRNALLNAVADYAGLSRACTELNFTVPSASECLDAPSFGRINGVLITCAAFVDALEPQSPRGSTCSWFSQRTLTQIGADLAASGVRYAPPPDADPDTTLGVELCKDTCGAIGQGPCWLRQTAEPWCQPLIASRNDAERNGRLKTSAPPMISKSRDRALDPKLELLPQVQRIQLVKQMAAANSLGLGRMHP